MYADRCVQHGETQSYCSCRDSGAFCGARPRPAAILRRAALGLRCSTSTLAAILSRLQRHRQPLARVCRGRAIAHPRLLRLRARRPAIREEAAARVQLGAGPALQQARRRVSPHLEEALDNQAAWWWQVREMAIVGAA